MEIQIFRFAITRLKWIVPREGLADTVEEVWRPRSNAFLRETVRTECGRFFGGSERTDISALLLRPARVSLPEVNPHSLFRFRNENRVTELALDPIPTHALELRRLDLGLALSADGVQ